MNDSLDLVAILDASARRFERLHGWRPVARPEPHEVRPAVRERKVEA